MLMSGFARADMDYIVPISNDSLSPALKLDTESLKNFFQKFPLAGSFPTEIHNPSAGKTGKAIEDRNIAFLKEKLKKIGELSEKEKMITLLILTNRVKMSAIKTMGRSPTYFYNMMRAYGIDDKLLSKYRARGLFIKCGIAKKNEDGSLELDMKDFPWGIDKNRMKILGRHLRVRHSLEKNGALGRFDCENFRFPGKENEEVELEIEDGVVKAIRFLSDNTYAEGIFLIYENKSGKLIDSTRKLGLRIKDIKDHTVRNVYFNKKGALGFSDKGGLRLKYGPEYRGRDGGVYSLANEEVELMVEEGIIVEVKVFKDNLRLGLNIVYDAKTKKPVYSFVGRIRPGRMKALTNHYVESTLQGDGTLEAGGERWFTINEYGYYPVRYWVKDGWVEKADILKDGKVIYTKYISLIFNETTKKIVGFLRSKTLEDLSELENHSVVHVLKNESLSIKCGTTDKMVKVLIKKSLPDGISFPIVGKLRIKKGLIDSFIFEEGKAEDFFYGLDKKTGKVIDYFIDMGEEVFKLLSGVTIVKRLSDYSNQAMLRIGNDTLAVSFPLWCKGKWAAFDVEKPGNVDEVIILEDKINRNPLLVGKGKMAKKVRTVKGKWVWEENIPLHVTEILKEVAKQVKIRELDHLSKLSKNDIFELPFYGRVNIDQIIAIIEKEALWIVGEETDNLRFKQKIFKYVSSQRDSYSKLLFLIEFVYLRDKVCLKILLRLEELFAKYDDSKFFNADFININVSYLNRYGTSILDNILEYEDLAEYRKIINDNKNKNMYLKLIREDKLWRLLYVRQDLLKSLIEKYSEKTGRYDKAFKRIIEIFNNSIKTTDDSGFKSDGHSSLPKLKLNSGEAGLINQAV